MTPFANVDAQIARLWRESIVPALQQYICIPNKSPLFEPRWSELGHMERAVQLFERWSREHAPPEAHVSVQRLPGRTPLLLIDMPGDIDDVVLLYGHLDKQPEFTGWRAGLGPWTPVLQDGRLYGRGGADDGYALFASVAAIRALRDDGRRMARCLVLIEASEESGSVDLPAHLELLGPRLGNPSLVVCLDAECGNYEQLWCTTSLRGIVTGTLRVQVLTEGVHSGMGTGIAATPLRIAQQLLARIENPVTGDIVLEPLRVPIPAERITQARAAAAVLGAAVAGKLPFAPGVAPLTNDPLDLLLGNTWRPTLAVIG
ncbi:MAG: M20/M25/M40 family metallo-hydrolase, partial [Gammaproteobacteria bacterium]|nr:M20/M25/M40 family metallo-hydrolase [Gammaproteobacteria bacterium]